MIISKRLPVSVLIASTLFAGGPLGFMEQRFAYLHFEKDKWTRAAQPPCYTYTARQDNATVEVLGIGSTQLIPFRAKKGLSLTACGEIAVLEEGFETGSPILSAVSSKR